MTGLREAAQMALDYLDAPSSKVWAAGTQYKIIQALRAALENEFNPDWDGMAVMVEEQQRMAKRIEELESALAQPKQEPWGYISHKAWKMPVFVEADDLQAANLPFNNPDYTPVYKAPPQREWQGLTDDDFIGLTTQQIFAMKFAEAKLREKNA